MTTISYSLAAPIITSATDPAAAAAVLPFAELELDPVTGDLAIPGRIVRGVPALVQRLRCRYRFFLGEWFLDTRQGMPYFQSILVKNPSLSLVSSLFRRATLSTPGVQTVQKLEVSFDRRARKLTVAPLQIVLTGGVIFRAQPNEFILPLGEEVLP